MPLPIENSSLKSDNWVSRIFKALASDRYLYKQNQSMKSVITILAVIFATVAHSQTQIAGKVTDQKGAPIPGANIFI